MADIERAEDILEGAKGVTWIAEGRQMVQQIVEEAKHTLQTARERAATIEAEGERKAQEIVEETKKTAQAKAEEEAQHTIQLAREEAQHTIQMAGEEAQHIIQLAREKAVAAIAKENDALLMFMMGVREEISALSEIAWQRVATSGEEKKSAEADGPQAQLAPEEPLPQCTEDQEDLINTFISPDVPDRASGYYRWPTHMV